MTESAAWSVSRGMVFKKGQGVRTRWVWRSWWFSSSSLPMARLFPSALRFDRCSWASRFSCTTPTSEIRPDRTCRGDTRADRKRVCRDEKSPKRRPSCEGLPCLQMRFPSDERLLAGFVVLVLFLRRIVFLVHLEDTWIGLVPVIYRGALDWPQDEEGLPANVCSGDGRRFRSRLVLGPRRVGLTSAAMTGTEPEPCRQPEDLEGN